MPGSDRRPAVERGAPRRAEVGYRWTCPICGRSRLNWQGDDGTNARVALGSHVSSSDDDEHGPANAYPPGLDRSSLAEHVERIEH